MTARADSKVLTAADEGVKLTRSLGRIDLIFFTVGATFALDSIAQIAATGGAESFTWGLVVAVTFLVPYAFITAELGSAFPMEGGPYFWVKLAFGRLAAAISTMLWWITNPVWLGILAAVVSIRLGKYFLNVGTIIKLGLVAFFLISVVIYGVEHGVHGYSVGNYAPSLGGFLAVTPVLLFAVTGYEAENGAAEEMRNPQRDVPISVAVSGSIATLSYLVPILAMIVILPVRQITGAGGFMDAVSTVFSVYGGAHDVALKIVAVLFVFCLLHQGAAWMIGSDRVQAIAGVDGSFPKFFGKFHPRLETPVSVNLLSGVVATVFCVLATTLVNGSAGAIFAVVLTIAITTLLLSYLIILPSAWALRRTQPDAVRPFRVPGGGVGLGICTALVFLWVAFGSFVAVFPGVLERLFGIGYDFEDTWGVSRTTFEVFTLGTLAVVVGVAVLGYLWRRPARSSRLR